MKLLQDCQAHQLELETRIEGVKHMKQHPPIRATSEQLPIISGNS
jgi:hypothetical protein